MRKTGGVAIVKVKRVTGVDVSREWIIDKLETGKKNRTKKIPSSVCVCESGSEKKKYKAVCGAGCGGGSR